MGCVSRTASSGRAVRGPRTAVLLVVALFGALAVAACAWIYDARLAPGPPIRSDGTGYYLYLPAVLLDGDATMRRTAKRSFAGRESEMQANRVRPGGPFLDRFTAGEAIMLAPFFAGGHVAAHLTGAEPDGFSRPYQGAAAAGGLTYALAGVAVLGLVLLRSFSTGTVTITLLAIVFATPLFHYATFDAVYSHAFSFFLIALTVLLALTLAAARPPRLHLAVAMGLTTGLVTLVRPTNAVVLLFVALVGIEDRGDVAVRLRALREHARLVVAGAVAFVVPWLPQVAYWRTVTGKFLTYTYGDEHLQPLHPHLLEMLFSVRKGLFFWTPLLVLAVVGVAFLRRVAPSLFLATAVYLVVQTWVVASWETWSYGGSLGQRAFVDALPVCALGLAALVEWARGRLARRLVMAATAVCTALAVHATLAYWLEAIPYDGTTWRVYVQSFRQLYS